jgi:hypothetical protein
MPSWLSEWDTTPQEKTAEPIDVEETDKRLAKQPPSVEDDIRRFRESLRATACKNKVTILSSQFSAQFEKSLTLGLVSMETLEYALQHVSVDIREACPNEKLTSYVSLAFYAAVWEGIEASKVIGPTDIDAGVLNQLVSLVASLPVTRATQALAHRILHSVSGIQLRKMKQGITCLVQRWSESWLAVLEPGDSADEIESAESLVAEAVEKGVNAQIFAMSLEQGPDYEQVLGKAEEAISGARAAVLNAIDATIKAEDIISPLRVSAKALALALGSLPHGLLFRLLPACTNHIITMCGNLKSGWSFRHRWLCVVAQMPNVGDYQLVRTWKTLDPRNDLRGDQCSEVFLHHWISQNKVKEATAVTNTASSQWCSAGNSLSFARLLLALDKHREMCFTRTGDLFYLLRKLGRHREISDILCRMEELDMKIPTTILGAAVEKMSAYDTKRALEMWNLPSKMKLGYPLRPDFIPQFVLSMIDDPEISSETIWNLLNIPMHSQRRSHRPHFAEPLPQEMIDLMHKMASAFARSEARPPRVAFRNICQCLHHLRIHRAPISPELTRAVNHAGTTRSIMKGMIVGKERLRYMLYLISKVEGEGVAKEVDETVYKWRQFVKDQRHKLRRGANPLRVGALG